MVMEEVTQHTLSVRVGHQPREVIPCAILGAILANGAIYGSVTIAELMQSNIFLLLFMVNEGMQES